MKRLRITFNIFKCVLQAYGFPFTVVPVIAKVPVVAKAVLPVVPVHHGYAHHGYGHGLGHGYGHGYGGHGHGYGHY